MKILHALLFVALMPFVLFAGEYPPSGLNPAVKAYWFNQGAEISKYDLRQARYGEIHEGHAVLVFVTEPFNAVSQVKSDQPQADEAVAVLKMNATRKFVTGVYPYSTMTSVFTPMEGEGAMWPLKVTTSVQEWCGQVWHQMNLEKETYRLRGFSYFESQGDVDERVPKALSEDGLWTLLRLDPKKLPVGEFKILPGSLHTRLKHTPFKAMLAEGRLETRGDMMIYRLHISELARDLEIHFGTVFPHRIESWKETYASGWGASKRVLTTTATRTHTIFSPYWGKNSKADRGLRKQLGL